MKPILKLQDLLTAVKGEPTRKVAVAAGQDPDTILAIARAVEEDVIKAILVGNEKEILRVAKDKKVNPSLFDIMHADDDSSATTESVLLVREKKADMLMKGSVNTSTYMKAILDKDTGLLPQGKLLSHVAVMEIPTYPKLLLVSDAAIIPTPDLDQKIQILNYAIEVANALGNQMPKVALVSANENISFKVQSSMDAAVITAMSQRKQIRGAIIDGPLALDVSLSPEHCVIKELESPIHGEADILIFPNIETANTFYKSTTLLAKGTAASIVVGTTAPVILTSRTDEDDSKFFSIVLAARLAAKRFFEIRS